MPVGCPPTNGPLLNELTDDPLSVNPIAHPGWGHSAAVIPVGTGFGIALHHLYQPALGMRVAQVEVQPDEGGVLFAAAFIALVALFDQPSRRLRGVDDPRWLGCGGVEQVAGDQSGFVASVRLGGEVMECRQDA